MMPPDHAELCLQEIRERLLLGSRVVAFTMSSHLILRPSYSLKPLFFNYLRNELKASDTQLRRRPWNPTRATPEGKPHPMPEPTQYLLNIVKNYYRKTNKVVARSSPSDRRA